MSLKIKSTSSTNTKSSNKSMQEFIKSNKAYGKIANHEKYMEISNNYKRFSRKNIVVISVFQNCAIGPTLLYS